MSREKIHEQDIFSAIHLNDSETILRIIFEDKDLISMSILNQRNSEGIPPLCLAVQKNLISIVNCLIFSMKINVNQCTSNGSTALMLAIENNNADIVEKLLGCIDIKVNLVRYDGLNAYDLALKNGNEKIISLLDQVINEMPNEFKCSVNLEIFKDPVILTDGNTYERADIVYHLKRSNKSPLFLTELENTTVWKNNLLLNLIRNYSKSSWIYSMMTTYTCYNSFNKSMLFSENPFFSYKNGILLFYEKAFITVELITKNDLYREDLTSKKLIADFKEKNQDVIYLFNELANAIKTADIFEIEKIFTNSKLQFHYPWMLHNFCRYGEYLFINKVLNQFWAKKLIYIQDHFGNTMLHFACFLNKPEIIKILLQLEPTLLNIPNLLGQSPLHLCLSYDTAFALLQNEFALSKLNICDHQGRTPLHIVCRQNGPPELIRLLLRFGEKANMTKLDQTGNTPFHSVINFAPFEIIEVFLNNLGEEANQILIGKTKEGTNFDNIPIRIAFLRAAHKKHLAIFKFLLIDKIVKNFILQDLISETNNYLHYACFKENEELVEFLLENGFKEIIKDKDKKRGYTALEIVSGKSSKLVGVFLNINSDDDFVNNQNNEGFTALYNACISLNAESVYLLLRKGARVDIKYDIGQNQFTTVLHLISSCSQEIAVPILSALLKHGAKKNINEPLDFVKEKKMTPLHLAFCYGTVGSIKLLLVNGAFYSLNTYCVREEGIKTCEELIATRDNEYEDTLKDLCFHSNILVLYKYALRCIQLESKKQLAIEIFSLLDRFVSIDDDDVKIKILDMTCNPANFMHELGFFEENFYKKLFNLIENEINEALGISKIVSNIFN